MSITKNELCSRVAKRTGLQATDTKLAFDTALDEIFSILSEGNRIEIRGFGIFTSRFRKERNGRNPRTGEPVLIPPHKVPAFKFSKDGVKVFGEKILNGPAGAPKAEKPAIPAKIAESRFKV